MSCKIDVSNSVAQGKRGPISLAAQDAAEDEDASAVDPADTWTPERASEITKHRAVITTDLPEACPMETNLLGLAADLLVASYLEHSEVPRRSDVPLVHRGLELSRALLLDQHRLQAERRRRANASSVVDKDIWRETAMPSLADQPSRASVCARDAIRTKERTPGMGS